MTPRQKCEWMLRFVVCSMVLFSMTEAAAQETPSLNSNSEDIKAILSDIAIKTEFIEREIAAVRARLDDDRGICANNNFSVMCAASELDSRDVLASAEHLRRTISQELLGIELPGGAEFTIINVTISQEKDEGVTLLANGQVQGHHRIWLTTSKERAVSTTLAHELTHVVLNSEFPTGMPAWAGEGLASSYDDTDRKAERKDILISVISSSQRPVIAELLNQRHIAPTDVTSYTVGTSLTEFCLTKGDRKRFVEFAQDGISFGWDTALNRHYGISDVGEFQRQWERWVHGQLTTRRVRQSEHVIATAFASRSTSGIRGRLGSNAAHLQL